MNIFTSAWVWVFLVQLGMGRRWAMSEASRSRLACFSRSRSALLMVSLKSRSNRASSSSAQSFLGGPLLLGVETLGEVHQPGEGLFDGGAVLLAVVVGDDLLVLLVVVHPQRILGEHLGQLLLDHVADVLQRRVLCAAPSWRTRRGASRSRSGSGRRLRPPVWSSPGSWARMASLTIRCSSLSTSVTSAVSRRSCSFL